MRAKYQATSHAHGLSKTPEYRIWAGIKQRCFNPKRKEYERYGKAGITMHQPWVENFEEFYDHLGPRPSKTHSVDRIDNSLGYEPGNVRWATPEEQAQNSSIARPITLNGRTMTASEWSRELGVGFTTIIARLNRNYSAEDVLSRGRISSSNEPRLLTFNGETKRLVDWAREIGITDRALKKRLRRGVPLERALKNPMP